MKQKSPKSLELYDIMIKRGYPEEFCNQITKNLNTDWTAGRMIGYLSHYKKLPLEEIVDEMLAILSDRNRIMQKHELEATNAKWNEYLNRYDRDSGTRRMDYAAGTQKTYEEYLD